MKNVLKVVLLIAVAGLVFICYRSVMNPIEFQEVKEQREEVVIKRLVDIKKAQEEYYSQNNEYAPDFETLIEFVRTGRMGVVRKIYELNDEQQAYILSYVNDQIKKDNKKRRNSEQVEEYHGLTNNQADSVFLAIHMDQPPRYFVPQPQLSRRFSRVHPIRQWREVRYGDKRHVRYRRSLRGLRRQLHLPSGD